MTRCDVQSVADGPDGPVHNLRRTVGETPATGANAKT
jgi:hypothetical protein